MFKATPFEWMLIDAANQFGTGGDKNITSKDKLEFETRVLWGYENLSNLEALIEVADKPTAFAKVVFAIRDTQDNIPVGHLVGLDSAASGIQMLSTLTRCVVGMRNTGVINSGVCPDIYRTLVEVMSVMDVLRKNAKRALMTYMYSSEAKPKEVFGENVDLFYQGAIAVAPRACIIRNQGVSAWQPFATDHSWVMPNNCEIYKRVWVTKDTVIQVPNLNKRSFTFRHKVNQGTETGRSLIADITHGIDGFVVQEMSARCNYNVEALEYKQALISEYITDTSVTERTQVCSLDVLPEINAENIHKYPRNYLAQMLELINRSLEYPAFAILSIHDEFKCHPNNVQRMREAYNRILWDFYHSDLLFDIFEQITGQRHTNWPFDPEVAESILTANYALN